jgi:hypothetical protein
LLPGARHERSIPGLSLTTFLFLMSSAGQRVTLSPRAGESVSTAALTLDMSKMSEVQMAADGKSVRVGAGARVGE